MEQLVQVQLHMILLKVLNWLRVWSSQPFTPEIIGDKGTIFIGSISALTNIKIRWKDGTEEQIIGDIPKHVVMSGEVLDFYNYVTNHNKYKREYQYASEFAVKVCEVMETMRKQADIRFR
ncbi:MAG: hypothetical protein WCD89_00605 [Anaerocolumna sp.]